jgi:hypothetical protein
MSYGYGKSIVTDGLVFYVDAANGNSYPGSGTDWANLSGSATATLTNAPTYSSSNGGYFSFDGTNDHVATTYDATGKIDLTFCVWLNIDNFNITNGGAIFDQSTGSTGFGIRTSSSDTIQVFARNSDASSLNYLSSAYTGLSTGTWYYVCVKFETNSITTYLDGAVNATNSATLDTISVDSSNDMEIGGRNDTTDGHLDGSIALVQIYEKGLSNDEVLQNYNALKNRFI